MDKIAETDANDPDDMPNFKKLVDDLIKLGATVKIYDSDEYGEGVFDYQEISHEEFINNIIRLQEILEELRDSDDNLADESKTC
ncbi:hypothetical protein AB1K84_13175 [Mesobacillus foraminis]|uniref:hypothetical protein n=1 Tax=Mesobacillus foraminis TaxID=279826 RepID=UPI0039A0414A